MNFFNLKKYLALSASIVTFCNCDVCLSTEDSNYVLRVNNEANIEKGEINYPLCSQVIECASGNIKSHFLRTSIDNADDGIINNIDSIMRNELFRNKAITTKLCCEEVTATEQIVNLIKLLQFACKTDNNIMEEQVIGQEYSYNRDHVNLLHALFQISKNCDIDQVVKALEKSCSTITNGRAFNVFEQFIQLVVNSCKLKDQNRIRDLLGGLMVVFNEDVRKNFHFELTDNNAVISYYNNYCFKQQSSNKGANSWFNTNDQKTQKMLQDVSTFLQQLEETGYSRFPMKSEDYVNLAIYIELIQKLYPNSDVIHSFLDHCKTEHNKNIITSATDLIIKIREYLSDLQTTSITNDALISVQQKIEKWKDLTCLKEVVNALGYEMVDVQITDKNGIAKFDFDNVVDITKGTQLHDCANLANNRAFVISVCQGKTNKVGDKEYLCLEIGDADRRTNEASAQFEKKFGKSFYNGKSTHLIVEIIPKK